MNTPNELLRADEVVYESLRESFPASDAPAHHLADDPPGNAQARWDACGFGLLAVGTVAPSFLLPISPTRSASLADYRGRPLVLVFFPADWSPVCGDQLALYTELQEEFDRLGAVVLGLSVDGPWCHAAFREARGYSISLLADFEPKGEVARSYGVYSAVHGTAERALFVIDAQGIVRWSHLSPIDVNPGADGILAALESLQGMAP